MKKAANVFFFIQNVEMLKDALLKNKIEIKFPLNECNFQSKPKVPFWLRPTKRKLNAAIFPFCNAR